LDVKRRQAHAADRDAMAGSQFFGSVRSRDGDAAVFPALLDLYDFAYFFDYSGKHKRRISSVFLSTNSRLRAMTRDRTNYNESNKGQRDNSAEPACAKQLCIRIVGPTSLDVTKEQQRC
jgi:hypothetical protein